MPGRGACERRTPGLVAHRPMAFRRMCLAAPLAERMLDGGAIPYLFGNVRVLPVHEKANLDLDPIRHLHPLVQISKGR